MCRCSTFLSACFLGVSIVAGTAVSQTKPNRSPTPKPAATYDYSNEAVIFETLSIAYDFNADGTGVKTSTIVAHIQSDAAVRQLGVITLPYAGQNEQPEIVYVRVRKNDGSIVQTPPEDAQDMPSRVSRIAPFYSDLKEKQIPVKSLSLGDTLEYQVRFME